jgi:hypothetical protein
MAEILKLKKARDFGSLISDSFYYVRRHFALLGKSILYFVVPLIIVTAILSVQFATQQTFVVGDDFLEYYNNIISSSIWSGIAGLLAMTVLMAVVYNHMKLIADDTVDNESLRVEDIWAGVKSDFFMILLITAVAFICTLGGFMLFIIPGIFISVKLLLTTAVYVIEDRSFGESFSRSWNLITNNWWITFGLAIVMYIFILLMNGALSMPFVIIAAFAGFSGLQDPATLNSTFGIIYSLITSLNYVFYTIMYLSLGLHYFNLVERKEGRGLEERIDEIDDLSVRNIG